MDCHAIKMNTEHIDKEYIILENIYNKQDSIRQRDLAHIAGISLGMTNAILKRLVMKGYLIAKKINRRNIHYAVTPDGINAILKRSYRYFKATIKNIVLYKERILTLLADIQKHRYQKIILVGNSDLDFIFEHCCKKANIGFSQKNEFTTDDAHSGGYGVFSENIVEKKRPSTNGSSCYLYDYLNLGKND
jgi:DNA-binding MarR family transcriptional regulator